LVDSEINDVLMMFHNRSIEPNLVVAGTPAWRLTAQISDVVETRPKFMRGLALTTDGHVFGFEHEIDHRDFMSYLLRSKHDDARHEDSVYYSDWFKSLGRPRVAGTEMRASSRASEISDALAEAIVEYGLVQA
jgi:hypothetical protein